MAVTTAIALWQFGASCINGIDLVRNLVVIVLCYAFVLASSFVWNFFGAPGLLDTENQQQMVILNDKLKRNNDFKTLHLKFAALMNEGRGLQTVLMYEAGVFGKWLQEREAWMVRVCQALVDLDVPTEAAAFRQAAESNPNPREGGAGDTYWQEFYGEQLQNCRKMLGLIVERRLPYRTD